MTNKQDKPGFGDLLLKISIAPKGEFLCLHDTG